MFVLYNFAQKKLSTILTKTLFSHTLIILLESPRLLIFPFLSTFTVFHTQRNHSTRKSAFDIFGVCENVKIYSSVWKTMEVRHSLCIDERHLAWLYLWTAALGVHPATTIQQMSSEHHRTNQSTKRVKRDCWCILARVLLMVSNFRIFAKAQMLTTRLGSISLIDWLLHWICHQQCCYYRVFQQVWNHFWLVLS